MSSKASLRILPEENSLRESGPFVDSSPWPPDLDEQQPRALKALSRIIEGGLCHRCGSCVGICPTKVLGLDGEDYPTVVARSACTDCDLCVKVCPGDEFDFHAQHKKVLGVEGEMSNTHGHFSEAVLSYATDRDIRENSTSGGLVTGLLLDMLENKEIDGAVIIVSDEKVLWKGKPIVARTREELLSGMKSKYAISPTNAVFRELREIPGKYALVGLPCQIHGFCKAAELDSRLRERVVLTVGLYCHAAVEHEAYRVIWDSLGEKNTQATKFVSRIGKHPGAPHVQMPDKSWYPVYFGDKKGYRPSSMELINIIYRLYTPARCLTCFDASAEFADIAVGDPWMAPPEKDIDFYKGWSFALVRTERGAQALKRSRERAALEVRQVTRSEALACNKMMSNEKRWRAFRVIETLRRQGHPIPSYGPVDSVTPKHTLKHFIKTEIHMLTHMFCYLPRQRAAVLRFMLSQGGYILLWLNHKRRTLRFFLRDTKASLSRTILGRQ